MPGSSTSSPKGPGTRAREDVAALEIASSNQTLRQFLGGSSLPWEGTGKNKSPPHVQPRPRVDIRPRPTPPTSRVQQVLTSKDGNVSTGLTNPPPLSHVPATDGSHSALSEQSSVAWPSLALSDGSSNPQPHAGAAIPPTVQQQAQQMVINGAQDDSQQNNTLGRVAAMSLADASTGRHIATHAPSTTHVHRQSSSGAQTPNADTELLNNVYSPESAKLLYDRFCSLARIHKHLTVSINSINTTAIDKLVDLNGGWSKLSEMERPRVDLILRACSSGDMLYLCLHQIFALHTLNDPVIQKYPALAAVPATHFQILKDLIRDNELLSVQTLKTFAIFPLDLEQVPPSNPYVTQIMPTAIQFLPRFASSYANLKQKCWNARRPPMFEEVAMEVEIVSNILQLISFNALYRSIKAVSAATSTALEAYFRARQLRYNAIGERVDSHQPPTKEEILNERNASLMALRDIWASESRVPQRTTSSTKNNQQINQQARTSPVARTGNSSFRQPHSPVPASHNASIQASTGISRQNQQHQYRSRTNPPAQAGTLSISPPIPYYSPNQPHSPQAFNGHAPYNQASPVQEQFVGTVSDSYQPVYQTSPLASNFNRAVQQVRAHQIHQNRYHVHSPPGTVFQTQTQHQHQRRTSQHNILPNQIYHQSPLAQSVSQASPGPGQYSSFPNHHHPLPISQPVPSNTTVTPGVNTKIKSPYIPLTPRPSPPQGPINEHELALHQAHLKSPQLKPVSKTDSPAPLDLFKFVREFALAPFFVPQRLGKVAHHFEISTISPEPKTKLKSNGTLVKEVYEGSLTYRLRCVRSDSGVDLTQIENWVLAEHVWPPHICLQVNSQKTDLRRRAHHNKDLPLDLGPLLRQGSNLISCSVFGKQPASAISPTYMIGIEVMETSACASLLRSILEREKVNNKSSTSSHKTGQDSRHIPSSSHTPSPEPPIFTSPSADDDLTVLSTHHTISVADPFSSSLMKHPVKGRLCKHIDAFDLESFLSTRKTVSAASCIDAHVLYAADDWKCPCCKRDARPSELRIDHWLQDVVDKLWARGEKDIKAVVVKSDGSWEPKRDNSTGAEDWSGRTEKSHSRNASEISMVGSTTSRKRRRDGSGSLSLSVSPAREIKTTGSEEPSAKKGRIFIDLSED